MTRVVKEWRHIRLHAKLPTRQGERGREKVNYDSDEVRQARKVYEEALAEAKRNGNPNAEQVARKAAREFLADAAAAARAARNFNHAKALKAAMKQLYGTVGKMIVFFGLLMEAIDPGLVLDAPGMDDLVLVKECR